METRSVHDRLEYKVLEVMQYLLSCCIVFSHNLKKEKENEKQGSVCNIFKQHLILTLSILNS